MKEAADSHVPSEMCKVVCVKCHMILPQPPSMSPPAPQPAPVLPPRVIFSDAYDEAVKHLRTIEGEFEKRRIDTQRWYEDEMNLIYIEFIALVYTAAKENPEYVRRLITALDDLVTRKSTLQTFKTNLLNREK